MTETHKSRWKEEILKTEREFSQMSIEKGIDKAFLAFADDDAVLMRNNALIKGKSAIENRFKKLPLNNGKPKLSWEAEFVDVSSSGDLGYTYGSYTLKTTDSTGESIENTGVFHTVWKRHADGSWKFVWD